MMQSDYSRRRNNPRQFYSPSASLSSPDSGNPYGPLWEMGPPPPVDFPPQPVEIDSSRTLPSPAVSSPAWDPSLFQGFGLGDIPYGSSSIPKMPQTSPVNPLRNAQQDQLSQWYLGNDGPWIPKVIPAVSEQRSARRQRGNKMMMTLGTQYRPANQSDAGSFQDTVAPSDSGYGTRRSIGNTSVYSAELPEQDQDCHSLVGHVANYQRFGFNDVLQPRDTTFQDQWTPPVPNSVISEGSPRLQCPSCLKLVKTPSEMRKHDQRHNKPFVCTVIACTRIEGFSTSNDLDRHMKSKHPDLSTDSKARKRFRCLVPNCKSRDKSWPRLDNFRSHLKKIHINYFATPEDFEDMARRAVFWELAGAIVDRKTLSPRRPSLPSFAQATGSIFQESSMKRSMTIADFPRVFPDIRSPSPRGFKTNLFISAPRMMSEPEAARGLPNALRTEQRSESLSDLPTLEMMPLDSAASIPEGPSAKSDDPASPQSPNTAAAGKATLHADVSAPDATVADTIRSIFAGAKMPDLSKSCLPDQVPVRDGLPKRKSSSGSVCAADPTSAKTTTRPSDHNIDHGHPPHREREAAKTEAALEILKTLEELGYVLQKGPGHPPKAQRPGSTKKAENKFSCSKCEVTVRRRSELKKHMKRHERPYGCTFTKCNKDFGSKNDWKRHENSQHYQNETWRCNIAKIEGGTCTKVSYRRQNFQEHLKKEHSMKDEGEIKITAESLRIGQNCEARFWCGFCEDIVELKGKGQEAWTERFDHIDDHFMGRHGLKERHIRDWIPVDNNKPIVSMKTSPRPDESPEGDSPGKDSPESASSDESPPGSPDENTRKAAAAGASPVKLVGLEDNEAPTPQKRKRESSSEEEEEERRPAKRTKSFETMVFCASPLLHCVDLSTNKSKCQCNMSYNRKLVDSCSNCPTEHRFCGDCKSEFVPPYEDEE